MKIFRLVLNDLNVWFVLITQHKIINGLPMPVWSIIVFNSKQRSWIGKHLFAISNIAHKLCVWAWYLSCGICFILNFNRSFIWYITCWESLILLEGLLLLLLSILWINSYNWALILGVDVMVTKQEICFNHWLGLESSSTCVGGFALIVIGLIFILKLNDPGPHLLAVGANVTSWSILIMRASHSIYLTPRLQMHDVMIDWR